MPGALFVSPAATVYGSERSMLTLLQSLDLPAQVACPAGGGLERELQALDVRHHPLAFSRFALWRNPLGHLWFYRRVRRILDASRPDALVINLGGNTPLVTLAGVRSRLPIIRFSRFEFRPPTRRVDRYVWLKADAVVCPSEHVREQILRWAPPSFHPRVHAWYDPIEPREVDPKARRRFAEEMSLEPGTVLGYVGRIHPAKGLETVLRALPAVRDEVPGVRLLVAGHHDGSPAGAAYLRRLHAYTVELEVQDRVHFLGYRRDVPEVMSCCDVCVLPSRSESFGMVLTEAWTLGVPTVASDVGGAAEITRASGGGRLAGAGDVDGFARHILELLRNRGLARSMGASGRAWVVGHCDPVAYAGRFGDLVRSLTRRAQTDT